MEWRAILPGHPRIQLTDPTNARYSVSGMNFWLSYGKDEVHDYFVYESRRKLGLDTVSFWAPHDPVGINRFTDGDRLVRKNYLVRGKIRLGGVHTKYSHVSRKKPRFKISWALYEKQMGWIEVEPLPPYKQEEQNGSISSGEAGLEA